jgi:hypothetical protein
LKAANIFPSCFLDMTESILPYSAAMEIPAPAESIEEGHD